HPPDDLADAATEMARHELECRQLLEYTAHDQPREREARVERPADARREAELLHALLAVSNRRRMHEHRNVEIAGKPKEWPSVVVVRIGATVARADQHAAQVVLFHRALELLEVLITTARDRDRKRDQAALVLVAQ